MSVSLLTDSLSLTCDDGDAARVRREIVAAVKRAGYAALPEGDAPAEKPEKEADSPLPTLIASLIITAVLMVVSMGPLFILPPMMYLEKSRISCSVVGLWPSMMKPMISISNKSKYFLLCASLTA